MKFFGLEFSADGVRPDPGKAADIQRMKAPQTVAQLQEFLGIATYMSPFIPNLSQKTATLRDLVKKDAEYMWTDSHNAAFEATKSLICRDVTLAYFDLQAESVIQVDASSRGLGAVLIQHGKPIAFASKSLSDCEQRYANIESEMLAVVFGCERFHMYVYGKSFVIESDHKPLEMINLKNLAAAPQRLQRMFLRVQPYDFVLRYKPGKQMMLADAMSRQPSSESTQIDLDIQVSFVQFSTQKLQSIREATQADDELCALRAVIVDGWPDSQRHLAAPLRPYWSCRVRDTQTDTWQPAKVISTDVQPRSYNVLTPTGNVLRRNRRYLRETTERHTFQQDNVDDTDDLTRSDDMQVVPPPCNSVLPQKKSVRFQLPQPEQYTSSGRRVKRPQRLDL